MKQFVPSRLFILLTVLFAWSISSFAQTTFSYTGGMVAYTVPAGVTTLNIDAYGAAGGFNSDESSFPDSFGKGARVHAALAVTAGEVLNLFIGGVGSNGTSLAGGTGGFNGGGNGQLSAPYSGGGGGGATDIRVGGITLANRIIIAAGGGGAGLTCGGDAERGGDGGGLTGGDGDGGCNGGNGFGGTPGGGGAGGACGGSCTGAAGSPGTLGIGGDAGVGSTGGGGGGGYYGGGGAQMDGGGGGSDYTDPIQATSVTNTRGFNTGAGFIIITCPLPVTGTITGATAVCMGSTTTLSDVGGGAGGTWSSDAPPTADVGSTGIVTGFALGTADISYTLTNVCGSASATTTVTVETTPATPAAITGSTSLCQGTTTPLADLTPGGVWSATNGTATVVGSTGVVTGVAGGVDTILYSFTNVCGTAFASYVITVNPLPVVPPIAGAASVCVAASTPFSDGTPGGTWTATNGTATVSISGMVTGVAPGIDTIIYTVTNGCGTVAVTKPININPLPVVAPITGPSNVCPGLTITLTDSGPAGVWSTTNGNATVVGGVVTGVALGIDTIDYTVTNSCGSAVASVTVDVTTTPFVAPITGPTSVCITAAIPLSDATAGGVWSATNGNATISGGGVVIGVTPGLDTIDYIVTIPCGADTVTYVVTVLPPTSAGVISGPSSVCVLATITLTSTIPGGFWNSSNGTATVSGLGVVMGAAAGIDTINYTVFDACGVASTTFIITVLPLPFAGAISGLTDICLGSSITLTDPVPGGFWTATNTNATVVAGTVTGAAAGSDTINYSVFNTCGTDEATHVVTVFTFPVAGTITGPAMLCVGITSTLADASPGGIWANTTSRTAVSGGMTTGITPGLDTIEYSVTNVCGTASTTYPVTVNPQPVADTVTGPTSVCVGASVTLVDTATGGVWSSTNASATIVPSTGILTGAVLGRDTVIYSVTNYCGTATASHAVTVNDVPVVTPVSGPTTVCVGAAITMTDTTSGGVWGHTGSAATVSGAGVVTGVSVGTVHISYTVSDGCGSTSAVDSAYVITVPTVSSISGLDTVCPHRVFTYTDTAHGGIWTITNTNAFMDDSGHLAGRFNGLDTAIYTVTNICGTSFVTFTVYVLPDSVCDPASVTPLAAGKTALTIYPNPNQGTFTLLLSSAAPDEPAIITITNIVGEKVNSLVTTTNKATDINLNTSPGIYFVNVTTGHGRYVAKVTVE